MKYKILVAALGLVSAWASSSPAQTAQTALFRAVLNSSDGDTGAADVALHLVKDPSGTIQSGSVNFQLAYQFPNDEAVTGLGITGPAGGATFLLAANITAASPVDATAGSGRISRQVQIPAGNQAGISLLAGILANPAKYAVSVVTASHSSGAMSGVLQAANSTVLMALVSSSAGAGAATVIVTYSGPAYAITSAAVTLQLTYRFASQVTFSGMRVYSGQGEQGQITVAAGVLPGTPSAAAGTGVLTAPPTQIDMNDTQMVQAVQNMLSGPGNFSVDIDTVENPTAPLTGPLRRTDSIPFPIPSFAGGSSEVLLYTLRQGSGTVAAATVILDINYRLAAGAQISSLDLDGDVTAPVLSTDPSGAGNAYVVLGINTGAGLAGINSIVIDPASHQIDLQAGSKVTAALAPKSSAAPVIVAVIPIVEVTNLSTFAPGELIEVYGTDLAQVTTDLSGWIGPELPSPLNGVSAMLAGHGGRILYVSPNQVDVLLPFGSPTGLQKLTLTNNNGASAPFSLNIAPVAPALYPYALKNADFSIVSTSNPAHAGDVLVLFCTGMGQTTPTLFTGEIVPLGPPFFNTATATVTVGGANAEVAYSIAAPPYVAGLYQIAFTVPAGVAHGSQAVVATSGGLPSNTVNVPIE